MEGKRSVSLTGSWDTRISRRVLLRTGGSAAAGLLLLGRTSPARSAPPFDVDKPFSLGVASGDPTPDGFVLWTRLLPEGAPLDGSALKQEPYGVRYEVAADEGFTQIVRRGSEQALWEEAHTVHAEIAGLEPNRWYWYRFKWGNTGLSAVGRTRTAPALGADVPGFRFAFASCQNYAGGYYGAYEQMAAEELDLVVHLGDYIYEGIRPQAPFVQARLDEVQPAYDCLSLSDYRTRHALYRSDDQLQLAHHRFPWLATWDDHEVANNYAGLVMDPEVPLLDAKLRRAAAYLAYWEHQPLSRSRKPVDENMPIFRRAFWGNLATFHVIDTRQYRSDQIAPCAQGERLPSGYCPPAFDDQRTMLGAEQEDWLVKGLQQTSSGWNVIANQVGFAPEDLQLNSAVKRFNPDSWDGYAYSRKQLLDVIAAQAAKNTVVITGDKHYSSVRNVPPNEVDFLDQPIATEFIGTSISSGGQVDAPGPQPTPDNPHHLWKDLRRGYVRVELDPTTWHADYRLVKSVVEPKTSSWTESSWDVTNGLPGARRTDVPAL
jgi:alkaline phosphatase D